MAIDPQLRKIYRQVSKKITRLEKAIHRAKFLSLCVQHKVFPRNLQVKTPEISTSLDQQTQNNYSNAAFSASMKFLHVAVKDSKADVHKEQIRFDEFLKSFDENQQPFINEYLSKRRPQISRKVTHNYHQKLKSLVSKSETSCHMDGNENIVKETGVNENVHKSKPKNRRFIPRHKYRKLKQHEARKQLPSLVHNFSSFPLTEDMHQT